MNEHVSLEIQLQPFDILDERRNRRRCRLTLGRNIEVRREQDLLLGQIGDEHAVAVLEVLDVIELDRVRLVLEHALLASCLYLGLLLRLGEIVSDERARRAQGLLQIGLVVLVRDDGDPIGRKRRESAGMIEVRVCIDDVLDRLVRDDAPGFGEDRDAARLVLSALEHDDVVFEFDGQRHVSTRDSIDAIGHFF